MPAVARLTRIGGIKTRARRRERRVLREEIRDQLIDDILNGRVAPGDRIIEARVAKEFAVSQAPVREALRDLDVLGFVESSPFRGAVVRRISAEELLQLYPIRAVLEGLAAREAATRIRPATLRKLQKLLATMRSVAAEGDERLAVQTDFAFHLTIVEASENRLLQQIWDRMRLATTTFLTVSKSHHSLSEIAERHAAVLDTLRAHDPSAAEQAMRRHIEEPGEWMRTALAEEAAGSNVEDTQHARSVSEKREHAPGRPASPAKSGRNSKRLRA
jgi:DNA-binding GntR family transcriptional regulator